jgi:hypothetical protein
MATVTFMHAVQMGGYPVTPGTSGGASFTSTQIMAQSMGVAGNFIGNFTGGGPGVPWNGTFSRVVISTSGFLELDITDFSFTTSAHIPDFIQSGVGLFFGTLLAGNDTFIGTAGADGFIGYDGNDIVSYAGASAEIVADLEAGGLSGEATGDTYAAIENLTGSNFQRHALRQRRGQHPEGR